MKKGLGDIVETVTKATGIKTLVDSMADGEECTPCQKRKESLNKTGEKISKFLKNKSPYKTYI